MILFRILWVIAAIVSLVVLYFLFEGLSDGTVNARNILLWVGLLAICAAALIGGPWLRSHSYPKMGLFVTAALAVPAFLFGLFMLLLILSGAKWN